MKNKGLVLLITTQRSGSTWLLDLLRSHPNITFKREADILGTINFNRYPVGLTSETHDTSKAVEIHRNFFRLIPKFKSIFPISFNKSFYVEKIHPFFFNNSPVEFDELMSSLSKRYSPIKIIYQSRDPESSLKSFTEYQLRDSKWYTNFTKKDILDLYSTGLHTISQISKTHKGMYIDFHDLTTNSASALSQIYSFIWPQRNHIQKLIDRALIADAINITSRNKRLKNKTKFLGKNTNSSTSHHKSTTPLLSKAMKQYVRILASLS